MNPDSYSPYLSTHPDREAQSVDKRAHLIILFTDGSQHTVHDVADIRAPIEAARIISNKQLTIFKQVKVVLSDGSSFVVRGV